MGWASKVGSKIIGFFKGGSKAVGKTTGVWSADVGNFVKPFSKNVPNIGKSFGNAGKTIVRWGTAAKVSLVAAGASVGGAIGYWILQGGLAHAIADALGVPEWVANVLLLGAAVVVVGCVASVILSYRRKR